MQTKPFILLAVLRLSVLRVCDAHLVTSGVASVPCALGQEIFLRRFPSTKLTEFELINRCKSAGEAKAEHLL